MRNMTAGMNLCIVSHGIADCLHCSLLACWHGCTHSISMSLSSLSSLQCLSPLSLPFNVSLLSLFPSMSLSSLSSLQCLSPLSLPFNVSLLSLFPSMSLSSLSSLQCLSPLSLPFNVSLLSLFPPLCYRTNTEFAGGGVPASSTLVCSSSPTNQGEPHNMHTYSIGDWLTTPSGVVWCGVVWCGVVWCGVVWCGVGQCSLPWLSVSSTLNPSCFLKNHSRGYKRGTVPSLKGTTSHVVWAVAFTHMSLVCPSIQLLCSAQEDDTLSHMHPSIRHFLALPVHPCC